MRRVESIAFLILMIVGAAGAETVGEKCSGDFQKVSTCLPFATGKAPTPTKECCSSVEDIKSRDPVCLCYIIQQMHNGSDQIKRLGIQEAKLLQLPSVCKLTNASVADCPKLLNLPPGSPDFAIFANATTTTAPSASTPSTPNGGSNGISKLGPNFGGLVAIALTISLFVLPSGFVSIFSTCMNEGVKV